MRASRLVSIILLLQARGQMTAGQLAAELEVSVRTIYRDVGSLQAAGIPLYGDAGPAGGYQLVAGYRTRLTGLTPRELLGDAVDRCGCGHDHAASYGPFLAARPRAALTG